MSNPSSPTSPAASIPPAPASSSEDDLRRQLRAALQSLSRREPLDATYKRLLLSGTLTRRSPVLPKDKFYRRIASKLRERVERYNHEMQGKDPFDRISQRTNLEEAAMRAAFTLREAKEHEQIPLLEATLMALNNHSNPNNNNNNMEDAIGSKRHLDGIALGLQSRQPTTQSKKSLSSHHHTSGNSMTRSNVMEQTEQARQKAELDRQRAQARKWEEARRRREDEERRRKEEELSRQQKPKVETPQQALHKMIEPVFKKLWDMEFANLGGTNPFRIVIDRDNCASIGAPDYFDVISIPMNLTYIQDKVNKMQYSTLQNFFGDVDLMISNALTYNSDPGNPYRVAAEEMKKRHMKIVKKVWQQLQQRQAQNK
jgi:hypothetical protein